MIYVHKSSQRTVGVSKSYTFPHGAIATAAGPGHGVNFTLMANIRSDAAERKVPFIGSTPKPRIVKLVISPQGEDTFQSRVPGANLRATW